MSNIPESLTENYLPELFRFLTELSQNNNRPWFEANRPRYEALRTLWLEDLERLIQLMSAYEPGLIGQSARRCAYRIYRDTRFSKDKTPYKTFFSAALEPRGHNEPYAGYYLHIGLPGMYFSGIYGGIYCPPTPVLRKLRQAIVDNIEEFEEIVDNPEVTALFPGWVGEKLKTVPRGYDKNHPLAELLKLKSYGKYRHGGPEYFCDRQWPERVASDLRVLQPMIEFFNYSIDE